MSHTINLSTYFTQNHYTQFLHQQAGYIVPMFYEIRNHQGDLKGFLLGTCHNLPRFGKSFTDVPEILSTHSKVWECFKLANRIVGETDPHVMYPFFLGRPFSLGEKEKRMDKQRERGIEPKMDDIFMMEAFKTGKQYLGLEMPTDPCYIRMKQEHEIAYFFDPKVSITLIEGETDIIRHQQKLKRPLSKVENIMKRAFLSGSEELLCHALSNDSPEEKKEMRERNHTMAIRADALMQQSEILSFIAIGAAHLPGEEGMCSLLRQKGYAVQRVFTSHQQPENAKRNFHDSDPI